jgi:hypothetical protein
MTFIDHQPRKKPQTQNQRCLERDIKEVGSPISKQKKHWTQLKSGNFPGIR